MVNYLLRTPVIYLGHVPLEAGYLWRPGPSSKGSGSIQNRLHMLHGARVLERKFAIEEHPFFDLTLRHAELCISSTFKSAFSPWGWAYTLGISQAPRAQWMMVSLQAFLCNSDVLVYQLLQVYWDKPKEYMWVLTPAERCGPDPEQNGRRPMVNLPGFCPAWSTYQGPCSKHYTPLAHTGGCGRYDIHTK